MILDYFKWKRLFEKKTNESFFADAPVKPKTRPDTPVRPSTPPRPGRPGPTRIPGPGEQEKPMADAPVKPKTRPDTPVRPSAPPRPGRPGPTRIPGPGEQEKPMAVLNQVIDLFFAELEKEKETKRGQTMIKKLHTKYAKF